MLSRIRFYIYPKVDVALNSKNIIIDKLLYIFTQFNMN